MDSKLKWGGLLCATILCLGLYVDNKAVEPINIKNVDSLSYNSLLRNAKSNDPVAQYILGQYYLHGNASKSIPRDTTRAQEWLKKAADQKHPPSAYEYATSIASANPKEAQKYYDIAISGGVTAALFAQAQLKLREATPDSIKEGLTLLAYSATKANDPLAQAYLAVLQYEGAGIKKDRVQAILTMQSAVASAPTEATKKDWDAKQSAWLATLTQKEQEELNERLMMGRVSNTDAFPSEDAIPNEKTTASSIAELIANLPINNPKAVGK